MKYKIDDQLSSEIVDRELAVLQQMPDLTPDELRLNPENFTRPQVEELIRVNTKNSLIYQQWLDLLQLVVPGEVDDKILLLRSLHNRRLYECNMLIAALISRDTN